MKRTLLIALATVLVSLRLSASPLSIALRDSIFEVPEIIVEAERPSTLEELKSRPGFISIIPMDDGSRRISSAADYLSSTVGCHVKSTGGYGAYSTASIRGASAKQVRIFIDGIPLSQAQSGIIDLANLPVGSLERIEIYRGFGPYDLSGSSIGGVINLVTRSPRDDHASLSVSYGSFSTRRLEASYSHVGKWDALATARVLSTKGDFEFLDDNGTPYNPDDDEIARRINNDLTEYESLIKLMHRTARGRLVISNQFYHREQGLPGYSAFQSRSRRMRRTYNLAHLGWHQADSYIPFQAGAFYLYQNDTFLDLRPKGPGVKPDETTHTISYGVNLRWHLPLLRFHQIMKGMLEVSCESFQPTEKFLVTVKGERQSRTSFIVTIEDEIVSRPLHIVPSARLERYSDRTQPFESVRRDMVTYNRSLVDTTITHILFAPSLGIAVSPFDGMTLKANLGRYYRTPSLMELFGYRGFTLPNPSLVPEQGFNRDLGIIWERGFGLSNVRLEASYFWSDVSDLIMYVFVPFAQTSQATNINSADIEGLEVALSMAGWHGFSFNLNLTHLNAVNTGPISYMHGKKLPNRPDIEASGKIAWHGSHLGLYYEYDHISGNYWNAANDRAPNNKGALVPERKVHNAGVSLKLGRRTKFSVDVVNLTDRQYEDVIGYPLPGRSFTFTCDFKLR